jgi:hypothetical protein
MWFSGRRTTLNRGAEDMSKNLSRVNLECREKGYEKLEKETRWALLRVLKKREGLLNFSIPKYG